MDFFDSTPEPTARAHEAFWDWFGAHEAAFRVAILNNDDVASRVFPHVSEALREIHPHILQLCGAHPEGHVELIFTADGAVQTIPFIEALVAAAPPIAGWLFTALKPPLDIPDFTIEMGEYQFSTENIGFYANDSPMYPDLIDITLVYTGYTAEDHELIANGCYILLDNLLGELALSTQVDLMETRGPGEGLPEIIPVRKLRDYLRWREKEFVERYDNLRYDSSKDSFAALQAETAEGQAVVALINDTLLNWDGHASHPWVLVIKASYDSDANEGMPDATIQEVLHGLDERLDRQLPEAAGYLRLLRETGAGSRTVYIAGRDFRKPSLVAYAATKTAAPGVTIEYNIYKDKYWRSFDQFRTVAEA